MPHRCMPHPTHVHISHPIHTSTYPIDTSTIPSTHLLHTLPPPFPRNTHLHHPLHTPLPSPTHTSTIPYTHLHHPLHIPPSSPKHTPPSPTHTSTIPYTPLSHAHTSTICLPACCIYRSNNYFHCPTSGPGQCPKTFCVTSVIRFAPIPSYPLRQTRHTFCDKSNLVSVSYVLRQIQFSFTPHVYCFVTRPTRPPYRNALSPLV